jgi:hypothetical protein
MKVWVVMEHWAIADEGDEANEIEAVHLSEAGANGNLEPDYCTSGYPSFTRERYVVEMEALP